MIGLGNDIIEIQRIEAGINRYGQRFLDKLFTSKEQAYCLQYRESARHFAGRFAAKEAIVKALGTGITASISWLDIEILNNPQGKPTVDFSDKVLREFGDFKVHISISHCKAYAMAVAMIE